MNKVIVLLCVLVPLFFCDTWSNYKASFFLYNKPGLSGQLTGTLYYSLANKAIRYTYKAGPDEIFTYDSTSATGYFIYNQCSGTCATVPLDRSLVMPDFYKGTESCSGVVNTPNGQCTVCTKPAGDPVQSICVSATTNQPVRIILADGTTLDLSNVQSGVVTAAMVDSVALGWGCVLNCGNQMDIVILVDESGSITGNYIPPAAATGEWALMRNFVIGFTNLFTIDTNKVNMGLVQFGTGARDILPTIISDQAEFRNTVQGLTKCRGTDCGVWVTEQSTYTGTGFINSVLLLKDNAGVRALRANVPKVVIIVTDGDDTQPNNPFQWNGRSWSNTLTDSNSWLSYVKAEGVKIIAVGVGSGIDQQFLDSIASVAADGVTKLSYLAASFDFVSQTTTIQNLGTLVCTASGSSNPCPGCAGICACGVCTCPDSCDDNNVCTIGVCNSTVNSKGGCFQQQISCDDKDACTIDSCDPVGGCSNTPVVPATYCDDKDPCTIDTCVSTIGCVNTPMDCTNSNSCLIGSVCSGGVCQPPTTNICKDNNACTKDCSGATNCVFTPIDCTGGNKCILPDCDPTATTGPNGCKNLTRSCDDGNACSNDTCNPMTGCSNSPISCDDGNACTDDTCNPNSGCVNTYFNVTARCFKGDICANYTCDKTLGCVSTPLVCPPPAFNNNPCIVSICDPFQGCIPGPYICNVSKGQDPNCFVNYCNSNSTGPSDMCSQKELDSCLIAAIVGSGAAVISVGAIIGIIIAAVVCAAGTTVGAVYGFTKGFAGVFENKSNIYEPETIQGKNDAYGRDSVFNQKPVKPQ